MDRLTHERCNGIKTGYWSTAKKEELIQRLAAYENTGLEPERIGDLQEYCKYLVNQLDLYRSGLTPDIVSGSGQSWISVEDKLPTKEDANPNQAVIAINKSDGFPRSWWYDIVSRYPQEFTRWMPFPKP